MEGREYFDAKFDGLKDLMVSQNTNLTNHVNAVSRNVKEVREDLTDHINKTDVHGLDAAEKSSSKIVAWLGLGLAFGIGILDIFRSHGK